MSEYFEDIKKMIDEKSREHARKVNEIIEREIKAVMKKFNCSGCDLIVDYEQHDQVKITVFGSHFKIENKFVMDRLTLPPAPESDNV